MAELVVHLEERFDDGAGELLLDQGYPVHALRYSDRQTNHHQNGGAISDSLGMGNPSSSRVTRGSKAQMPGQRAAGRKGLT
jgi:hypothetical protein